MADEIIFKLIVDLGDSEKQIDAFQKKLEQLKKEMQSAFQDLKIDVPDLSGFIEKTSSILTSGFTTIFSGIVGIARKAFSTIYDAGKAAFNQVADVVVDSVDAFATFEKKLGLVSKTTGLVGDDLKSLGDDLREIARPIGSIKAENLLEIASVAGQLGVKGSENIKAFSKEIAYGVIALDKFGGSAEKLSLHMAKSMNIYKLTSQNVGNMLSAIDSLSKATAANELEISNFNMALGQFNTNMQLSYAQATALGATFVASGMQASKAATQYGSAFNSLAKGGKALGAAADALTAAATTGYDGVAKLEQITGKSRSQFQSLGDMIQYSLGVNAFETLNTLTGSLNNIPNTVENINKGISSSALGIEMFGAIGWKSMSILMEAMKNVNGEQGAFTKNLDLANKAFDEGKSHMDSFARATDNYNEKVGSIKSIWNDILLTIGEPIVNALNTVLDSTIKIFDQFAGWVGKSEAVKFALEAITGAFQNIVQNHIIPLVTSMVEWVTKSQAIDEIFRTKIPSAMLIIQEWVGKIIDKIHEWFNYLVGNGDTIWAGIKQGLSDAWEILGKIIDVVKEIPGYIESISPGVKILVGGFTTLFEKINDIINLFTGKNETVIGFFQGITDRVYGVQEAFDAAKQASDDYTGLTTTGVKEVIAAVDTLKTSVDATTGAVNELGIEAVEQSVFPEMKVAIAETTAEVDLLGDSLVMIQDGVMLVGEKADQAFKDMAAAAKETSVEIDKLITKEYAPIPMKEMKAATVANATTAAQKGYTSATPGNTEEFRSTYADLNAILDKQKQLYGQTYGNAQVATTQIAKLAKGVYANTPYMGILDDMQKGIGENASEIEKLGYSVEYANKAVNQLGTDAVYQSVFPDIEDAVKSVDASLGAIPRTSERVASSLDLILAKMRDGQREATALDRIMAGMSARPVTTSAAATASANQATQSLSTGESGAYTKGRTETAVSNKGGVVINFQGQNIVNESSKNRYAREVSQIIKSVSGRSVNVG